MNRSDVLPDLPGVERRLTAGERELLARSLAGAMPASNGPTG
ncbi:MAG: hypothetical protein DIU55_004575 [Bacillota bacterium]